MLYLRGKPEIPEKNPLLVGAADGLHVFIIAKSTKINIKCPIPKIKQQTNYPAGTNSTPFFSIALN